MPYTSANSANSSGAERLLDFLALPDVVAAFLGVGLGVERRIESARRRRSFRAATNSIVSSTTRWKSARGVSS